MRGPWTNAAAVLFSALAISGSIGRAGGETAPGSAPAAATADAEGLSLKSLVGPVEIVFDAYDIPHIRAGSVEDALRALGYLHASERMWQMELFRRLAAGRIAELQGEEGVASDTLMRRLGLRESSQQALDQHLLGEDVERWLAAYAEGVNARMDRYRAEGWPLTFKAAGIVPEPWAPVDSVQWIKYMGWDQGGTDDDLWLGTMVEKLGADRVNELWPLDRPYEVPTIPGESAIGEVRESAAALGAGPSADLLALESGRTPRLGAIGREGLGLASARAPWEPERSAFGSNNWVVSGSRTASGKAMFANDPHLGFTIPMLWYAAHLQAPGLNVVGVTFPGVPFVIIGHNEKMAWGFTNLQSDAVDYFVETLDPEGHRGQYLHRGEWKPLEEREETIAVAGRTEPIRLTVRSTAHGPLQEAGGRQVALQWTGLGPTREARGLAMLNFATDLEDFLAALQFIDVPALNVAYADAEGNIAMAPWGRLPIRASGLGRVPVDGASGEFDWTGWIPREQLPLSVNPARGYLASANGRPTAVGYPHHLGWMWDPSYRTRRIHDLLAADPEVTFEDMQRFQFDHHDKAAEVFVPVLLSALAAGARPAAGLPGSSDAAYEAAWDALARWDFECTPGAVGPTIFARWFGLYRSMVWDDEWSSRGIEQPEGSWGFTGDNRREPALEVLEFMTRENPDSIWFDDRTTPDRENREDILRASFERAVKDLVAAVGPDPAGWTWGRLNMLALEPLVPTALARRGGQPLHGGPFTLNPGSDGKPVTGGASWRQVVEFSRPIRSAGVYPGGQSENFASPHYDDLARLWVEGRYAPLGPTGGGAGSLAAPASRSLKLLPG